MYRSIFAIVIWAAATAAAAQESMPIAPPINAPPMIGGRPISYEKVSAKVLREPTRKEMDSVYPAAARESEMGGKVVLRCNVNVDGSLIYCGVISENPPGFGFADAARGLFDRFRVETEDRKGASTVGKIVHLDLLFTPPK